MFILHITYRVFKAHASTVRKGSKQTTDTRLDTDNLNKNGQQSIIICPEVKGW